MLALCIYFLLRRLICIRRSRKTLVSHILVLPNYQDEATLRETLDDLVHSPSAGRYIDILLATDAFENRNTQDKGSCLQRKKATYHPPGIPDQWAFRQWNFTNSVFMNFGGAVTPLLSAVTFESQSMTEDSARLSRCMVGSRWQPLRPSSLRPTSSDNFNIITLDHLLKNNAFIENIAYFLLPSTQDKAEDVVAVSRLLFEGTIATCHQGAF